MMYAALGWAGTALYLGNHGYLSFHPKHNPTLYFGLNFIAAVALVISSLAISSWQAAATNLFWAIVSLLAFAKIEVRSGFSLSESWISSVIAVVGAGSVVYAAHNFSHGMAVLGWVAGALFCAAYVLFTSQRINRARFLLYNIIAALAMMPILFLQMNWPVFGLEVAWVLVSLFGWTQARHTGETIEVPADA